MFLDLSVISGLVIIGEIEYFQLGRQRYFFSFFFFARARRKKEKIENVIEFFSNYYHCSRKFLKRN